MLSNVILHCFQRPLPCTRAQQIREKNKQVDILRKSVDNSEDSTETSSTFEGKPDSGT